MTTHTAPVAPPLPLARNRSFRLLWFGESVSVLGNATTSTLLPSWRSWVSMPDPGGWAS